MFNKINNRINQEMGRFYLALGKFTIKSMVILPVIFVLYQGIATISGIPKFVVPFTSQSTITLSQFTETNKVTDVEVFALDTSVDFKSVDLEAPIVTKVKPIKNSNLLADPKIFLRGEEVKLDNEWRCMAMNMYFEGRGIKKKVDRKKFMTEVGFTTLKRVGKYTGNNDVCSTVTNTVRDKETQYIVEHKCHFSWYCDGNNVVELDSGEMEHQLHVANNPIEDRAYREATAIALNVLQSHKQFGFKHSKFKATHYVRADKNPYWKSKFQKKGSAGGHEFYYGH